MYAVAKRRCPDGHRGAAAPLGTKSAIGPSQVAAIRQELQELALLQQQQTQTHAHLMATVVSLSQAMAESLVRTARLENTLAEALNFHVDDVEESSLHAPRK